MLDVLDYYFNLRSARSSPAGPVNGVDSNVFNEKIMIYS